MDLLNPWKCDGTAELEARSSVVFNDPGSIPGLVRSFQRVLLQTKSLFTRKIHWNVWVLLFPTIFFYFPSLYFIQLSCWRLIPFHYEGTIYLGSCSKFWFTASMQIFNKRRNLFSWWYEQLWDEKIWHNIFGVTVELRLGRRIFLYKTMLSIVQSQL